MPQNDSTPQPPASARKGLFANLLLLAFTLAFFALVVELALRVAGFEFVLRPQDIQFGRPEPVLLKVAFREDDDLFWVQRDYPEKIARLHQEKPALVLLGDSCTALGHWDDALAALHQQRLGQALSHGNLAVAGWSSYQGRRQLERDVAPMAPRVVIAYFGWNDHWVGFGIEDKNVARVKRIFSSRYSGSRVVQLFTKAHLAWRTRDTELPNRVSLEDFKANLEAMAATTHALGARFVLITAPANHQVGQEPEGIEARWLRERSELVPLHQAYTQAARAAAKTNDALLCDLAADFAARPAEERARLFMNDGIHFQPAGDAQIAAGVYSCLEKENLLPLPPR